MNPALRQEYLAALGLETWVMRGESALAAAPPDVIVRPDAIAPTRPSAPQAPPSPPEPSRPRDAGVSRDDSTARETGFDWPELRARVAACTRCGLCNTRTQTVFGVGNQRAEWLIVGEAPGADEDRQGEPFVGRAGQLLNSMLRAIGLAREQVYIANVLKCRPPGNRDPAAGEAAECLPYLEQQIVLLRPKIMLAVGRIASQNLLRTDVTLGRLRRQVHHFGVSRVPLVVTYHPAYLLRTPGDKRKAWEDLKFAREVCARV
jgi:uracil-DNA glycosylase family 4